MPSKKYRTNNITSPEIPEGPGVYSWYVDLYLPERDTIEIIALLKNPSEDASRKESVLREFLSNKLFHPFRETPYEIKLSGKLKPFYSGKLEHQQDISDELVSKILLAPDRLKDLFNVLKKVDTNFLSPIYIGMAGNLRDRLTTHVQQIESYYSKVNSSLRLENIDLEEALRSNHKFALEAIVVRNIDPKKLYFTFIEFDFDNKIEADLENILNRLNYPLCGRN